VSVIKELFYLLIVSFIISYSIRPIQIILFRRGINKRISSVLIISIIVIFVISCITFLIPSILKESSNFQDTIIELQSLFDSIYMKLKPVSENKIMYTVLNNINDKINKQTISFMEGVFESTLNIGSNIITIAIIPIVCYYFLVDGDYIYNKLLNVFPVNWRKIVKKIGNDIDKVLGKYIASQFFLCFIIGIMTFIMLITLKVQFPIILSLFNAFFNIIPYFGPLFGAVPCILIALLQSPKTALWVAFWIYLIQQLEGNVLSPKITGDSVNMHPLTVIILLIIGGELGGFLGMILAIPIGVIFNIIYEDINYYIF